MKKSFLVKPWKRGVKNYFGRLFFSHGTLGNVSNSIECPVDLRAFESGWVASIGVSMKFAGVIEHFEVLI